MAHNMGVNPESEMLFAAFEKSKVQLSNLQKAMKEAGIIPGDPIYAAGSALAETMTFTLQMIAEGEAVLRRGTARLDERIEKRVDMAREHARLTREETKKIYTSASDEAIKQLNSQSDVIAKQKSKIRTAWTAVYMFAASAVAGAVFLVCGVYVDQQWSQAQMATERAQLATERAHAAQTDSALVQAARIAGPDRPEVWRKLMSWTDPVKALTECNATGRITVAADGRRSCTISMWVDPPPLPPVR